LSKKPGTFLNEVEFSHLGKQRNSMYIYNVTMNIEESIQKNWLSWMKEVHIPEMMATGKFSKALIIRIPRCSASEVLEESLKADGFHKWLKLSSA